MPWSRAGKQFRRSLRTKDRKLAERHLGDLKGKIGALRISDDADLNFEQIAKYWNDFRHYFATTCIEEGVDTPTVSRWLGHSDGGALAMQRYGHLRQEHSTAMMKRVSFAPKPDNIVPLPQSNAGPPSPVQPSTLMNGARLRRPRRNMGFPGGPPRIRWKCFAGSSKKPR